jgi:hypothetical protein
MDLPALVQRHGVSGVVKLFLTETAKPFATVGDDFEILDLFFDKYKSPGEQVGQLNLLYNKAQAWLEGTNVRIPMMSISHSDLMPIRTERSDAGLSHCEIVIDIRQEFCLFSLS